MGSVVQKQLEAQVWGILVYTEWFVYGKSLGFQTGSLPALLGDMKEWTWDICMQRKCFATKLQPFPLTIKQLFVICLGLSFGATENIWLSSVRYLKMAIISALNQLLSTLNIPSTFNISSIFSCPSLSPSFGYIPVCLLYSNTPKETRCNDRTVAMF